MQVKVAHSALELVEGEITQETVDAIVNAANNTLLGGGGVDGAIHRAGGPAIRDACKKIGGCATGDAVITTAGKLKARHVIHTVGPVWRGGIHGEPALLKSAYTASLALAASHKLASIAFPSVSTGAYGYPINDAARIALATVIEHLRGTTTLTTVRFVLFNRMTLEAYTTVLKELCSDADGSIRA
jgi:O-acetyl-ADP-ribose deacetylase (regulator of RNase III)